MILWNTKIRRNEEEPRTELRTLCLRVFVFIKKTVMKAMSKQQLADAAGVSVKTLILFIC